MIRIALPLFFLFAILLAWQALSILGITPEFLVPAPSTVLTSLLENSGQFSSATFESFLAAFFGFLLSLILGSTISILLSANRWILQASLPFFVFLQVVPVVSIAPLLVIWFGFGFPTVLACSVIVSIFPVIANGLQGLRSTRTEWTELFHVLRASRSQLFFRLKIPAAIPFFAVGSRIASGLAVVGVIVGEFIAGGGLGSLIDSARTQQRVDLVFGAIILSGLIGFLMLKISDLIFLALSWIKPFQNSQTES